MTLAIPFAIRGLDHVVLRVREMARVERFFCDVLGCTVEKIQADLGLVQLRAGRALIDLVDIEGKIGREGGAAPAEDGRNMDHFCLRIDPFDADKIVAHLRAHAVAPGDVRPRFGADGEGLSIYLDDPEGNRVELKGPPLK